MALQRMLNLKPDKDQKRLVLPSSSPKWQKNQIDVKMYLSGVVQVCFVVLSFVSLLTLFLSDLFLRGKYDVIPEDKMQRFFSIL